MMLKIIPLTALALGLSSGVALADRDHRGGGHRGDHRAVIEHRDSRTVRDHRDRRDWQRPVVVRDRGWHGGSRVIVRDNPSYRHVVRRPIYVSRPVIRHRYFNYYQRPSIIFESYGPRAGYFWVPGHWYWTSYEWLWQPGHYQPDPNYVDPSYGYYDTY